jgi:hypothetical protein
MLMASYASDGHGAYGKEVDLGEGLVGQCAFDKKKILLTSCIPDFAAHRSGLGEARRSTCWCCPSSSRARTKA